MFKIMGIKYGTNEPVVLCSISEERLKEINEKILKAVKKAHEKIIVSQFNIPNEL